jgi:hypothetical protein
VVIASLINGQNMKKLLLPFLFLVTWNAAFGQSIKSDPKPEGIIPATKAKLRVEHPVHVFIKCPGKSWSGPISLSADDYIVTVGNCGNGSDAEHQKIVRVCTDSRYDCQETALKGGHRYRLAFVNNKYIIIEVTKE